MNDVSENINFINCLKYELSWGNRHQQIKQELLQKVADKTDKELANEYATINEKLQFWGTLLRNLLVFTVLAIGCTLFAPIGVAMLFDDHGPLDYGWMFRELSLVLLFFILCCLPIGSFYVYYQTYSHVQKMILRERE